MKLYAAAVIALSLAVIAAAQPPVVNGPVAPDGTEEAIELPNKLHLRNCGGSDGAGLCVFTSISHSARWQNIPLLANFRDFMKKYPGGGWPEKVDQEIALIAKQQKQPKPAYIQVTGLDLDLLTAANPTPETTPMFVQLLKEFMGRKVGERIDVAEADANALVAQLIAQPVTDDIITPAVQRAMEQAFAGFQEGLDAVINSALTQFQDAQAKSRRHAIPAIFGPGNDGDTHGKTFGDWLVQVAILGSPKATPQAKAGGR